MARTTAYMTLSGQWGWRCTCGAESRYVYAQRWRAEQLAARHRCRPMLMRHF